MDRVADECEALDLAELDDPQLAGEIERRREVHDHWVDVYWREFIPLAHGIRLFGQFYNDVLRPEDPYEFMGLLAGTTLLSVRRNRELERIAAKVRSSPSLRDRLQVGDSGGAAGMAEGSDPELEEFERDIQGFEREFGGAVYEDQACFRDRRQVLRLILALANGPERYPAATDATIEDGIQSFLDRVDEGQRDLARELLELGRVSYRLRDDDNIHLARLEALVLEAIEEGRRRLRQRHTPGHAWAQLEDVLRALRNPNLVAEPRPAEVSRRVEPGFRAKPRQLVGQPAGPGVAVGPARVIESPENLFDFQAGEVLVCDAVDPNMTFVVPLASAVIERRGGMLIHGAIIAREYGLPCVTGIPEATRLISTGDRLTVDGYLGIVTIS
jgi:pyruvate,water dikinase